MNTILRIVLAVVVGVIVTSLLEYFNVLTRSLDVLLGIAAALVFYFGAPERL